MHAIHPLFFLSLVFLLSPMDSIPASSSTRTQQTTTTESTRIGSWSCGNIEVQHPISPHGTTPALSSPVLANCFLCRSQTLYLRTSLGLFPVSSINSSAKSLILSSSTCPLPSSQYTSQTLLSSAFSAPSHRQSSLLLVNCTSDTRPVASSLHNGTTFSNSCKYQNPADDKGRSCCWLVHDLNRLEAGFRPGDLGCSHSSLVFVDPSPSNGGRRGFGTRVSIGIPGHLPSICEECSKADGHCGIGLRCICHPKECEDTILSSGASSNTLLAMYAAASIFFLPWWMVIS